MASNLDDLTTIRARFLDHWDASIPVVFDNEKPITEPVTTWARLSVVPGKERRRSIAMRTYEQLGRIYLQLFVPDGEEDGDGWQLAESFAATFRDWLSDDYRIRCDVPEFRTENTDGEPYMILVSIPYTAQH